MLKNSIFVDLISNKPFFVNSFQNYSQFLDIERITCEFGNDLGDWQLYATYHKRSGHFGEQTPSKKRKTSFGCSACLERLDFDGA